MPGKSVFAGTVSRLPTVGNAVGEQEAVMGSKWLDGHGR